MERAYQHRKLNTLFKSSLTKEIFYRDYSTENLRYLSSQQALADLATFISAMNAKYAFPDDVKWIAFGGSYPGSLAAWLRLQYPHLVRGSMSASGPLLALLDFEEYHEVVANDLQVLHSSECVESVSASIKQLETALENLADADLNNLFNLCDPIEEHVNNSLDVSNLFASIADTFAGVAQYNNDNRGAEVVSVNDVCDIFTDASIGTEIERLANFLRLMYGSSCFDYSYKNFVGYLQEDQTDSTGGCKMG